MPLPMSLSALRIFILMTLTLSLWGVSREASTDMGSLVAKGRVDQSTVSVLASPSPVRVGQAFFSLVIHEPLKNRGDLNKNLSMVLSPPRNARPDHSHHHSQPLRVRALRSEGRHPGMLGALVELPSAGTWSIEVISDTSPIQSRFHFELEVAPPQPPWVDYWMAFALPVLGVLIFIWHQRRVIAGSASGSSKAKDSQA